ncbi:Cyclin N-terminal domain-containing protein [Forsythia ovata]|uniref:Cyclin N-terminal domain-containing protein n=1 Tax=Forsythia ovata TaxID=205694 RepID=A0ABD1TQD1_9LAMI
MAPILAFITSYFEYTNCIFELQKNPVAVNAKGHIAVDGAMPNTVVKKPAKKKATTKLKPNFEEVIDISSDTEEVKKEKPASCWLNYKPNEHIIDIDAADVNNDLAVVEYVEEIYKFYKLIEAPSISTSGPSYSRSNLRLLLGVLGASLVPVHVSNNDLLPPEEDQGMWEAAKVC